MMIFQIAVILTVVAATTTTALNLIQQNDEDFVALSGKRMSRGFFMGYPQRFSYGNRTRPTGIPEGNKYGPQYRPSPSQTNGNYGYGPQNRPPPSQISNGNYGNGPQNRPPPSQIPNFGNYGYGPNNSGYEYPDYEPQPPRQTPPPRFQYGRPKPK